MRPIRFEAEKSRNSKDRHVEMSNVSKVKNLSNAIRDGTRLGNVQTFTNIMTKTKYHEYVDQIYSKNIPLVPFLDVLVIKPKISNGTWRISCFM